MNTIVLPHTFLIHLPQQKMRIPSFTDRILWRSLPDTHVEINSYQSHDDITTRCENISPKKDNLT